jgi:hypothetical protein
MHRLWMIFAQTVTVSVAILFVISTLKPEWIGERQTMPAVTIQEATPVCIGTERQASLILLGSRQTGPSIGSTYIYQQGSKGSAPPVLPTTRCSATFSVTGSKTAPNSAPPGSVQA